MKNNKNSFWKLYDLFLEIAINLLMIHLVYWGCFNIVDFKKVVGTYAFILLIKNLLKDIKKTIDNKIK